ncbi:glucokinase [Sphingomicrobium nitratireducens]|uniref:glucokinase n=1 Tax=Sphingomicrobium nitratireducens TaxID=2964666 RepID=UPI00224080A5|nr:glucokinase [Sphingomicrobium nitratireducens]
MTQMVAVDLGGTHARFAIATLDEGGAPSIEEALTLKTADHADFLSAWKAYGAHLGRELPPRAAIAAAGPVFDDEIKLTNNPWTLRPSRIEAACELDQLVVVNDFEAVGHAIARLPEDAFEHLTGPKRPMAEARSISIVGPGTGLGVAFVMRLEDGRYHVQPTEGGHVDFAPRDSFEDRLVQRVRARHLRVSAERVVSGPAIVDIYETLAVVEGKPVALHDDRAIWTAALEGKDALAVAAMDRFCQSLGSVAGDMALAQGADAVVIAGGLGARIRDHLPKTGFANRFRAKGRFEHMMAGIPVRLVVADEPGLYGAAAAFACHASA